MSQSADAVANSGISSEVMEALRSMRVSTDLSLGDGRVNLPGRQISTTVDSRVVRMPSSATRRGVDTSVGCRVSLSQALAVVSPRSHSSSTREAVSITRSTDNVSNPSSSDPPLIPNPLRMSREPTFISADSHTAIGSSTSPQPGAPTCPPSTTLDADRQPPQRVPPPVQAPAAPLTTGTPPQPAHGAKGPSYAEKFKRRVDALGALNERGAGLTVRRDAPHMPHPPSSSGVRSDGTAGATVNRTAPERAGDSPEMRDFSSALNPVEQRLESKTAMQLFFEAEDGKGTMQRPGDFRRRVNVTNPSQWLEVDSSSSDVSDDDAE